MDGLHEVGIASNGLKGGSLIGPEEVAEIILLGLEIGELLLGQVVLQVAPDPFNGGSTPGHRAARRPAGRSPAG
jgi:hypothetical protein